MSNPQERFVIIGVLACVAVAVVAAIAQEPNKAVGREVSIERHLPDGEEFQMTIPDLVRFGEKLFKAKFTIQEGAGRPMSKGTGATISDPGVSS